MQTSQYSHPFEGRIARAAAAVCLSMLCVPAYAHGDFGPVLIFLGVVFLIVVAGVVAAISALANRFAKKRRIAQGLPHASKLANERMPPWYWIVLFGLTSGLLIGLSKFVGVASTLGRGAEVSNPLLALLMFAAYTGLCVVAIIGFTGFRKWGWWVGVALLVCTALAWSGPVIAALINNEDSALARALLFSFGAFHPITLSFLLLPSARERFFGTPKTGLSDASPEASPAPAPIDVARPAAPDQPSVHLGATGSTTNARLSIEEAQAWLNTVPGITPKFDADPLADSQASAADTTAHTGLSSAERWLSAALLAVGAMFVLWGQASHWPRANVPGEDQDRAVMERQKRATEPSAPNALGEKPTEAAAQNTGSPPSHAQALLQPMDLRPLSQDDYELIERNSPPGWPEPGKPHCRISLYSNSPTQMRPVATIWRSKNNAHILIFFHDGEEAWYGRAKQADPGQQSARLGGDSPSIPFAVRFELFEPRQPAEASLRREINIEVTSRPAFEQAQQSAKFTVNTSMNRFRSMQAREDCAYPAALAYLTLSPDLYRFGR